MAVDPRLRQEIVSYARRYNLDPQAVLSVGWAETGLRRHAVGDRGTSFGPFQLHQGGALPRGKGLPWAGSTAGIHYAVRKMAESGASGLSGRRAVDAIVRRFERPADPTSEVGRAMAFYGRGPGQVGKASPAPVFGGDVKHEVSNFLLANLQNFAQTGEVLGLPELMSMRNLEPGDETESNYATGGLAPRSQGGRIFASKSGSPIVGGNHGGEHGTSGLPGYSGVDYFASPGSPAVAPVSGVVTRLSGRDPRAGAYQGAGGPLGWSVYIRDKAGHMHYLTHMGSRSVRPGQRVVQGQAIGTVANYDKYGRKSHIHYGVR